MCGICGVLSFDEQPIPSNQINQMTASIAHRGPDGEGVWVDGFVGLGHRRLSIIDLTPSGHQPMGNETGDVIIVFNGELYNHLELRLELEAAGHQYHSRTDTETVIHSYEEWGLDCLKRFNGMFAFAIWDNRTRKLILARDRFGVKPLYYYLDKQRVVFGSEIKAILACPGIPRSVCLPALDEYFTFQNVLTDLTLFEGIKILPAGTFLTFDLQGQRAPDPQSYWDFDLGQTQAISFEDATDELYRLFTRAVTRQLMSDVPVASYLSGGMDSSSITTIARRHLGRMMTFTGGFDLSSASGLELGFDERAQAEMISNLLKTEHYEMVLHAGDMENIMPELVWHLEDLRVGQCYPNYYLARLAGKFVKVVLSGAGGDELFAGYPWRYYRGISDEKGDYYRNYYKFWQRLVPDEDKASLFNADTFREIRDHSTFDVFRGVFKSNNVHLGSNEEKINASLYFELKTFLHGLLVVEDKMSMAHSLETRVPFLDNDLVDFACTLPLRYKLRDMDNAAQTIDENEPGKAMQYEIRYPNGKQILRMAMKKLIPEQIVSGVKKGFSAPDASWFRGESIDYVNSLLKDRRARIYEFMSPAYVSQRLEEHTSGKHNHRLFIWSLLSFEHWIGQFIQ